MSIKLYSIKCPDCGANLPIEEERKQIFCSYCGAKIIIDNENEFIYRHIDEAGIKQAETERIVELKRLEIAEKRRESEEKRKKFKVVLTVILGVIGLPCIAIGFGPGDMSFALLGEICLLIMICMWAAEKKSD